MTVSTRHSLSLKLSYGRRSGVRGNVYILCVCVCVCKKRTSFFSWSVSRLFAGLLCVGGVCVLRVCVCWGWPSGQRVQHFLQEEVGVCDFRKKTWKRNMESSIWIKFTSQFRALMSGVETRAALETVPVQPHLLQMNSHFEFNLKEKHEEYFYFFILITSGQV